MDAKTLQKWIEHPEGLGMEEAAALERLLEGHPYFQAARFVFLRILLQKDEETFSRELKRSSVHIASHRELYRYLYGLGEDDPGTDLPVKDGRFHPEIPDSGREAATAGAGTGRAGKVTESGQGGYVPYRLEDWEEEEGKASAEEKEEDLIDRFIHSEPNMPKLEENTADNRDLSTGTPYNPEELFSETLAKIYVRQQLYEKAISTYIKLSLKYPEKSVYFADCIEKIKGKINNKE